MGSLGDLSGGLSTYHLPEEPRLFQAWRLTVRLALLAFASFFSLMFLSQQAHAADGPHDAASSQAAASSDFSGSDATSASDHGRTGGSDEGQAGGSADFGLNVAGDAAPASDPAPDLAPALDSTPAADSAPVLDSAPAPDPTPILDSAPAPDPTPVLESA